nr:hypothetical protein [Streptomyces sp. 846.5]
MTALGITPQAWGRVWHTMIETAHAMPTGLHRPHQSSDEIRQVRGRVLLRSAPPGVDLIVGKAQSSAIGTLVDRATRYVRLIHLPDGWKAPQVRDALVEQTGGWPMSLRRTLTWDQGRELYYHEEDVARG